MYKAEHVQIEGTDLWRIKITKREGNGPWEFVEFEFPEGLPKPEAMRKAQKRNEEFQS
jgi:hypothetical protein